MNPRYSFVRINPLCQGHAEYVVTDSETASYVFGTRTLDHRVAQATADRLNRLYDEWLGMKASVVASLTRRGEGLIP